MGIERWWTRLTDQSQKLNTTRKKHNKLETKTPSVKPFETLPDALNELKKGNIDSKKHLQNLMNEHTKLEVTLHDLQTANKNQQKDINNRTRDVQNLANQKNILEKQQQFLEAFTKAFTSLEQRCQSWEQLKGEINTEVKSFQKHKVSDTQSSSPFEQFLTWRQAKTQTISRWESEVENLRDQSKQIKQASTNLLKLVDSNNKIFPPDVILALNGKVEALKDSLPSEANIAAVAGEITRWKDQPLLDRQTAESLLGKNQETDASVDDLLKKELDKIAKQLAGIEKLEELPDLLVNLQSTLEDQGYGYSEDDGAKMRDLIDQLNALGGKEEVPPGELSKPLLQLYDFYWKCFCKFDKDLNDDFTLMENYLKEIKHKKDTHDQQLELNLEKWSDLLEENQTKYRLKMVQSKGKPVSMKELVEQHTRLVQQKEGLIKQFGKKKYIELKMEYAGQAIEKMHGKLSKLKEASKKVTWDKLAETQKFKPREVQKLIESNELSLHVNDKMLSINEVVAEAKNWSESEATLDQGVEKYEAVKAYQESLSEKLNNITRNLKNGVSFYHNHIKDALEKYKCFNNDKLIDYLINYLGLSKGFKFQLERAVELTNPLIIAEDSKNLLERLRNLQECRKSLSYNHLHIAVLTSQKIRTWVSGVASEGSSSWVLDVASEGSLSNLEQLETQARQCLNNSQASDKQEYEIVQKQVLWWNKNLPPLRLKHFVKDGPLSRVKVELLEKVPSRPHKTLPSDVLWVVTDDTKLWIISRQVKNTITGFYQDISNELLEQWESISVAGEARLFGSNDQFFLVDITSKSSTSKRRADNLAIGKSAFENVGISDLEKTDRSKLLELEEVKETIEEEYKSELLELKNMDWSKQREINDFKPQKLENFIETTLGYFSEDCTISTVVKKSEELISGIGTLEELTQTLLSLKEGKNKDHFRKEG